jgi:hypothetical protein
VADSSFDLTAVFAGVADIVDRLGNDASQLAGREECQSF